MIQQGFQRVIIPALVARALRGDDDEGKFLALLRQFGRAVHLDPVQVITAFPGTVQEDHQRPFCIGLFLVTFRKV